MYRDTTGADPYIACDSLHDSIKSTFWPIQVTRNLSVDHFMLKVKDVTTMHQQSVRDRLQMDLEHSTNLKL